jgi:ribosomal protein L37E
MNNKSIEEIEHSPCRNCGDKNGVFVSRILTSVGGWDADYSVICDRCGDRYIVSEPVLISDLPPE